MKRPADKLLTRYVFRSKKKNRPKTLIRLLLEIVILSILSGTLLFYINKLPEIYDVNQLIVSSVDSFLQALSLLFSSILVFGSIFLVIALALLALILIIAAFWRVFKVLSLLISRYQKNTLIKFKN